MQDKISVKKVTTSLLALPVTVVAAAGCASAPETTVLSDTGALKDGIGTNEQIPQDSLEADADSEIQIAAESAPVGQTRAVPTGDSDTSLAIAYRELQQGEFFYQIPEAGKVGDAFVVKAGIGEELNQAVLDSLGIEGAVTVEQGAEYDALKAEISLTAPESSFSIEPISAGVKPVIGSNPAQWSWSVTPIEEGSLPIELVSTVSLSEQGQVEQIVTEKSVDVSSSGISETVAPSASRIFLLPALGVLLFGAVAFISTKLYYRRKAAITTATLLKERQKSSAHSVRNRM